jgi:hypothetical protein
MIFWGYQGTGQEYWVVPEKYAHRLEKRRALSAAWAKANPEKKRALDAAWRKANPEKNRARSAAWGKANPERKRAWAKANPEKKRASSGAWAKANPEKKRASFAAWAKANPENIRSKSARRRALKLTAVPPDANKAFVAGFYAIAQRVSKCIGVSHDVDHIVPLALGGSHCHRNMQVIPSTWNYRKQDRFDYPLPDCYRTDGWMIV